MYVIVRAVSKDVDCPKYDEWHCYHDPHNGRFWFQIDLAQQLIKAGIRMDWDDVDDDPQ